MNSEGVLRASCGGRGSELRRTERSVALRVRGLGAEGTESDDDGEGIARRVWARGGMSMLMRAGRGRDWVLGELRTASRTGSKAGILTDGGDDGDDDDDDDDDE